MAKSSPKYTWVLLLFGVLYPIEVLGQYASPSLDPFNYSQNPAATAWRTNRSIGIAEVNSLGQEGDPKYADVEQKTQVGLFGLVGEFGYGVKTGLEILLQNDEETITYDDASTPDGSNQQLLIKTGAAAIGPFALGFTDQGKVKQEEAKTIQDPYYSTRQQIKGTREIQLSGISIKIGGEKGTNVFLGGYERKETYTLSITQKTNWTVDSKDYWMEGVFDTPTVIQTSTGYAIGLRTEVNKENIYRFEIQREILPDFEEKVSFSYTDSQGNSGTMDDATFSNSKIESGSLIIEAAINKTVFSIFGRQEKAYNSGTDSTLELDFGDTTKQRGGISLVIPFIDEFNISFSGVKEISKQLYSNGEYKQYTSTDSFTFGISYVL